MGLFDGLIGGVVGADLMQQLAAKAGIPVSDLADRLAKVLPEAVDKMTPGGAMPKG